MDAKLIMFTADDERREFRLKREKMLIGRKRTCNLRIPIPSVSREHAQIEQREDGVYLRDLGSSNGTFVDDSRVQVQKLEAGDTFRLGPVYFTLVIDGKPANVEPVRTILPGQEAESSGGPGGSGTVRQAPQEEEDEPIEIIDEDEEDQPSPPKARPEAPVADGGTNGEARPAEAQRRQQDAADRKQDRDEDPIASLESMAPEEEDEDEPGNASDTFDAIFGLEDEDDDSIPVFDDEEDEKKTP